MGDRAQVCIKDGTDDRKVYLYGHWIGATIYKAAAEALARVPSRHGDAAYLARAVFCDMLKTTGEDALTGETGFGIMTDAAGDVEHAIPVLDCATLTVEWEPAAYGRSLLPAPMTFQQFIEGAKAGAFNNL